MIPTGINSSNYPAETHLARMLAIKEEPMADG
jgi:hypothetical protein